MKNKRKFRQIVVLLLVVLLGCAAEVHAEGVSAAYLENSGDRTILELQVTDPPPTSIIVNQIIPAGVVIKSASPGYTKFSAGKNVVKWLLKHPRPGVLWIVLVYEGTLPGKGATAIIRCKSPSDGTLMTIELR